MAALIRSPRPSGRLLAIAGVLTAAALTATGCASGSGSALALGPQARAAQAGSAPEAPAAEPAAAGVLAVSGNVVLPLDQFGGLVSGNLSATAGTLDFSGQTSLEGGLSTTGLASGPSSLLQPSLGGALGPVGPGAALVTPSPGVTTGSSNLVTGAVQSVRSVSCPGLPVC